MIVLASALAVLSGQAANIYSPIQHFSMLVRARCAD